MNEGAKVQQANRLTPELLRRAASFLATLDDDWARLVDTVGPCALAPKPRREPYEALIRAVSYQQLHAKAGDSILGRLVALDAGASFPSPRSLLDKNPAALRACGFSSAKDSAIRGICEGALDGTVPSLTAAHGMVDVELTARLTALRGVGRWTVEMFLIYSLERSDVLPVDDFGVRDGYRRLKRLERAPTPRAMREIGLTFRPYRSAAAWYLWRVPAVRRGNPRPQHPLARS